MRFVRSKSKNRFDWVAKTSKRGTKDVNSAKVSEC